MNNSISFRHARKSDLPEIIRFPQNRMELFYFFPSASAPLTEEQLETQINERYESTVMLENTPGQEHRQVIGFANFYNVEKHNIGFLGNIILRGDKRRQGFGKQLVLAMMHAGIKRFSLQEIHLSCYAQNRSALAFYKGLGFKAYASEQRPDPDKQPLSMIHLKLKVVDVPRA